jgi:4-diphosphocytidyl-2-C-methyl-D-erythritol kinase
MSRHGVVVQACAKLNLGLTVGPRRADGFHELATLFQSISLADTLEIRPRARGFSLEMRFEDVSNRPGAAPGTSVPDDRSNLVLRAARLWSERTGTGAGASFRLIKRIPAGTGLGGGSADAAAALVGLSALHRIRLSRAETLELAEELGSDVPFAVVGGTALGRGRGERLEPMRLLEPFRAVVAVPRWRVSTARAFAEIDRHKKLLTPWGAKLRSIRLLGHKRQKAAAWLRLGNTFEKVLGDRRKDFFSLRDRLRAAGASDVGMSGSGSAVFGVLDPGFPALNILKRFEGTEALFVVRPRVAGLRLKPLP